MQIKKDAPVKIPALFVSLVFLLLSFTLPAYPAQLFEQELKCGEYYTLVSPRGEVLDQTARVIYVGDEFISEDNKHYRVTRVEGKKAFTETVQTNILPQASPVTLNPSGIQAVEGQGARNLVAVYHTHSDESYVPTDGSESIPANGGIFKVGKVFTAKLESMGVKVDHDLRPHEPHDAAAYLRSRRTAVRLMQELPAAIIDIHRDGVPEAGFYRTEINGESATKVRFVVGRENQNRGTNFDFARRLKAIADQKHPGLVKGIFLAKGNYNQDLSPRSLLLEVGTYTNSREEAQRGVAFLAEAIPPALGITPAVAPGWGPGVDWRAVFWTLLVLVLGTMLLLYIRTGSWQGIQEKLSKLWGREWGDLFGLKTGKKGK